MNLVGIRALNAFENTKYQFISTLITNLVAVALSLVAFTALKPEEVVIGLAVAFALSYWVGLFVTDYLLKRFTLARGRGSCGARLINAKGGRPWGEYP
jgi:Na+-driven multidrug efflux pump